MQDRAALVEALKKIDGEFRPRDQTKSIIFSTIHAFQGDERKVAIVVDVDKRFTAGKMSKRDVMALSHLHDDGCRAKRTHNRAHCAAGGCKAFQEAAARRQAEINDEQRRVAHVALSRPRDELIIIGHGKVDKDQSCLVDTFGTLPRGMVKFVSSCVARPDVKQLEALIEERKKEKEEAKEQAKKSAKKQRR